MSTVAEASDSFTRSTVVLLSSVVASLAFSSAFFSASSNLLTLPFPGSWVSHCLHTHVILAFWAFNVHCAQSLLFSSSRLDVFLQLFTLCTRFLLCLLFQRHRVFLQFVSATSRAFVRSSSSSCHNRFLLLFAQLRFAMLAFCPLFTHTFFFCSSRLSRDLALSSLHAYPVFCCASSFSLARFAFFALHATFFSSLTLFLALLLLF